VQLTSLRFRGLTRFTDPVEVDFEGLGDGLIAVVGPNGAGKTTLFESAPASLYKTLPTRPGSLYEHCTGRGSYVETTWDDQGQQVTVRLQIDAEKRTLESYVFVGVPGEMHAVTSGRAAEFDAEISKRFGSLELFLSSVFACQSKRGSFLQMKATERKALFVELLGLSRLQVLHESAKQQAGMEERGLDRERALAAAVENELQALPGLEARLRDAQMALDTAAGALDKARMEETAATEALARARGAEERIAALVQAEQAARLSLTQASAHVADTEARPGKLRRAADDQLKAYDLGALDRRLRDLTSRHSMARDGLATRRRNLEAAIAKAGDADAAQEEIDAIEAELEALRAAEREAEAMALAIEQRRQEENRLRRAAELRGKVPCTEAQEWSPLDPGDNPDDPPCMPPAPLAVRHLAAKCPLLADANAAAAQLDTLGTLGVLVLDMPDAGPLARRKEIEAGRLRLPALRETVANARAASQAREQLAALAGEEARLQQDLDHDRSTIANERQAAEHARAQISEHLAGEMLDVDEQISSARVAREVAAHRHTEAQAELLKARADIEDVSIAETRVTKARTTRETAEATLRTADRSATEVLTRITALREKENALTDHRRAIQAHETGLGDWNLLATALGRDGVQALEIDAAGPEVARLTNELLAACYGPRFSLTFETLREKKSSPGEYSEAFDVRVYDGGAERQVEALSGGERVIVGEALGLAIAIFNARKSGIRYRTMWRDETAGALDPDNASAYVSMLRRARELGGFAQVLFVSHQKEVQEAADVRLLVEGGRVSVEAGVVA
jgi:exonuclease SbcC